MINRSFSILVELVFDTSEVVQEYERTYASVDQLDEELGERDLCDGPCDGVSACVWIHQAVGCSFEE